MKNFRILTLIMLVALLCATLAGFAFAEDEIIVGYIAYTDGLDFSLVISNNMKENAEQRGIKLLKTDSNGDAQTALQAVDTFLMQGADFIVDSTWVAAATQAMAQKCLEAACPSFPSISRSMLKNARIIPTSWA